MEGIINNLATTVDIYINNNGIKYSFIAEKMGISPQLLRKLLIKKNFNIDDANRILECIGCRLEFKIVKI